MKKLRFVLLGLLLSVMNVRGAAAEQNRVFMVSQDSYELTEIYNGPIYLDDDATESGTVSSAFYRDGYVYVFQNFQLCAFPLPTGSGRVVAQPVTIENYGVGEDHFFRFYFFGATDSGEVYAASYVHSRSGQANKPFEIFLLNFDKGWDVATVGKHWELPLGTDSEWGPRNPRVTGDLSAGNFTVGAQVWEQSSYNSQLSEWQYTTKIALWTVSGDLAGQPQWGRAVLSPSLVTPLGANRVLIHDKQYWSGINPKFTYGAVPQIAELTGTHQLKTVSTLGAGCTQLDRYSCGAAIFDNGGNTMMLYHCGIGADEEEGLSDKMVLAYLPGGSEDLANAQELTTLMPLDNVTTSAIKSNEEVVSHVSAVPLDDDRTLLLAIPYSHPKVLGAYILSRESAQTGIETATGTGTGEASEEIYTLEGIRIDRPLTPGFYIRRQGTRSEKFIIK